MKKYVYCLYDVEFHTYLEPHLDALDPTSFVSQIGVSLRGADKSKISPQYLASEFHHLGYFDTEAGTFESIPPVAIARIRDLFRRIELEKMENEDGSK